MSGLDTMPDPAAPMALAQRWLEQCRAHADTTPLIAPASAAFRALHAQRAPGHDLGVALDLPAARQFADLVVTLEQRGVSLRRAVSALHDLVHGATGAQVAELTMVAVVIRVAERFQHAERETSRRTAAFASTMAHELQNPIGVASGALTILKDDSVDADQKQRHRFLDVMGRSLARATTLIRDMSLLLPADSAEPRWRPFRQVLHDVFDEVGTRAENEDLRLSVVEPVPEVDVDDARTLLVLMNLVWNAVKYHDASKSDRWIRVGVVGAGHDAWHCFVADNGLGIAPEQQAHVFDRLVRLRPQHASGVGLGLTICQTVLEQVGGRIWLDSTPGAGATFYFTLPARPGRQEES